MKVLQHLLKKIIKSDFKSFFLKSFYTLHPSEQFIDNWHIDCILQYLEKIRLGKIKRLIINLPPRNLKSFCVTVCWPAWLIGHNPAVKIIAASHTMALSKKFSNDCRKIISRDWYQDIFEARLSNVQNTSVKFCTNHNGYRLSCSTGSNITGEGADHLIIDDPMSTTYAHCSKRREKINYWFSNTFATRLNNKKNGSITLVTQRIHQDDLTNYLLKQGDWEILKIQSIATSKQIFNIGCSTQHREIGDILCPKREGKKELNRVKKEIGDFAFEAQYQQNPISDRNGIIKKTWFPRYQILPKFTEIYQSWDTAVKIDPTNDYSVCTTWGVLDEKYYLIDVFRNKLPYSDLKNKLLALYKQYNTSLVIVEDKASGQQLLQDTKNKINIAPFNSRYSKLTRFFLASNIMESKKILLPKKSHWLNALEGELFSFPQNKHDDQVDSITQFLLWHNKNLTNKNYYRIAKL